MIQSYGTFSWVGAFLGRAKEVHKPYTSNNWANHWAEESYLFVDDQPEYVYHNTETGKYFETAAEVLAATDTAFVRGVLSRPKPHNMPPIASNPATCTKVGGKWAPCGGSAKAATCSKGGGVIFRSPCGGPCWVKDHH